MYQRRDNQLDKLSRGKQGTRRLRTKETDFVPSLVILHEELVPILNVLVKVPGRRCGDQG